MVKKYTLYWLFLFWVLPHISHANLNDKNVVSWNLQGSSASTESKWNANIRTMLIGLGAYGDIDILNVQEAGSVPSSAQLMPQLGLRLDNPNQLAVPVEEYEWNLSTSSRPNIYYIYFSRVDTGGNRVNLAIVSRQRASRVIILGTSVYPSSGHGRPILGIEVGGAYYFSIHATANGGSDSGVIVERVWDYFRSNNNPAQWMISGDFNRSPNGSSTSLQGLLDRSYPRVSENVTIISQPSPTHINGGNLDYSVVGQINNFNQPLVTLISMLFVAVLYGQQASDHIPVIFYKR
ncbi:cytolethal distending toxin subunit B family protein [Serratia fonticola]|uniref:cytolethal distending toxin subunit B family protein n=1 Tax=Serratia fonticola TaxID=47917 RepID=UPI001415580B|nr:cytolethal distending toxin subunit B family protein [Serratia fonticola]QIP94543.1 Endonuclease/exonuclease/phosphatase [Serratia fonticola]